LQGAVTDAAIARQRCTPGKLIHQYGPNMVSQRIAQVAKAMRDGVAERRWQLSVSIASSGAQS
jgi:hypothetical protein